MIKVSIPAQQNKELKPNIVVIGVGGAGGNAVDNMIASDLEGVNFVVCNTDAQALQKSLCDERVQLGTQITQGLGAGSDPDVGRAAAEESIEDVMRYLDGMNMVFITCGMGGGTGTGAAPVIARAAREKGLLTVGVVTKPFQFEGANRMRMAEAGLDEMQEYVDTLIVIPNQNLFRIANENTTFSEAFKMADGVLQSGVRGVTDLMVKPGMINLDFADVRCTMREMGKAMMGTGEASGENRAIEAAEAAINNPLLDDISMKGARGVIINITGGYDMTLMEVEEICDRIGEEVDPDANIIFGSTFDDRLEGIIRVSVVATGIESNEVRKSKPLRPADKNENGIGIEKTSLNTRHSTPLAESIQKTSPASITSNAISGIGTGQMPTSLPASSVNTAEMPEQKVVGSDVSYSNNTATQSFNSSQTANQSSEQHRGHASALSAHRQGGAFIPPKAVQPEEMAQSETHNTPQQHSQQQQQPAQAPSTPFGFNTYKPMNAAPQQPQAHTQAEPKSQGLVLNPPKLPTPDQVKKAPSLFERMTGMVKQITGQDHAEDEFDRAPQQRPQQSSPMSSYKSPYQAQQPQQNAPQQHSMDQQQQQMQQAQSAQQQGTEQPVQGQLNVTVPQANNKSPNASDADLEIPAFLRRQAN